jgi:cysteine desulfurase family protein
MAMPTIYFDNAATSYPKPESVYAAQDRFFRQAGNPGRGGHTLAMNAAREIFACRLKVAELIGAPNAERLIFTSSCTHSINAVLKGVNLEAGDSVLISALEHNAVMRPLTQLARLKGIKIVALPYAQQGIIDMQDLTAALASHKPKLCAFMEASNVTGETIELASIADACLKHGVALMVDAAQTAGTAYGKVDHPGITFWCASAHKSLLGAPGLGLLYVAENALLEPLIAGGTGSASESLAMPEDLPDHLEAGTANSPAIAALAAAVDFITAIGVHRVAAHEQDLLARFISWCRTQEQIKIFGRSFASSSSGELKRASLVSFSVEGITPDRVADILNTEFNIAVRSGLHCAAHAHANLGTTRHGLTRVSFGFFNTLDELGSLQDALSSVCRSAKTGSSSTS